MLYWYSSGRVLGGTVKAVMREASARVAVEMPVDSVSGFPENLTLAACGISVRDTTFSFTRGGALDGLFSLGASLLAHALPPPQVSPLLCSAVATVVPPLAVEICRLDEFLTNTVRKPLPPPYAEPLVPDTAIDWQTFDEASLAQLSTTMNAIAKLLFNGGVVAASGIAPITTSLSHYANISLSISQLNFSRPANVSGLEVLAPRTRHTLALGVDLHSMSVGFDILLQLKSTTDVVVADVLTRRLHVDVSFSRLYSEALIFVGVNRSIAQFVESLIKPPMASTACFIDAIYNISVRSIATNITVSDVVFSTTHDSNQSALTAQLDKIVDALIESALSVDGEETVARFLESWAATTGRDLLNSLIRSKIALLRGDPRRSFQTCEFGAAPSTVFQVATGLYLGWPVPALSRSI